MNSITIEIGDSSDLEAAVTVENRCFSGVRRCSRRSLLYGLRSPAQRIWIAWAEDRQPAGMLTLHLRRRSVRVYSLAVMPAFRGIGLGQRLMEKAFIEARLHDFCYVSLEVEQSERRLVRWYEQLGFETVRRISDYYDTGRHALLMHWASPRQKRKEGRKST